MSRVYGTVSMGLRAPIIRQGDNMVEIYKKKMQPGELISYEYTLKMYNNEI